MQVKSRNIYLGMLVALVSLPALIFYHIAPLADFLEYWLTATLAVFSFSVVVFFSRGSLVIPGFSVKITMVLFGLLAIALAGPSLAEDVRKFLLYSLAIVALSIFSGVASAGNRVMYYDVLAAALAVAGVMQALFAIAVHYGVLYPIGRWMAAPSTRMAGFPAQPNLLALYLFCAFVATCYLYMRGKIGFVVAAIVVLLVGIAMAGAGSRMSIVYTVVSGGVVLWVLSGQARQRLRLASLFVLLSLGIPLYLLIESNLQPLMHQLGYIDRGLFYDAGRDFSTVGFRPSEWHKAWLMLWEHPWLGVGFGNYGVESFWMGVKYPWAVTENSFPTHSHNIFAQVAAEFGLGGLLLVGLGVAGFWYGLLKAEKNIQWWLVLSISIAFMCNAMVEYALWDLHYAAIFIVVVSPVFDNGRTVSIGKNVAITVVVGMLLLWGVVSLSGFDIYRKAFDYRTKISDRFGWGELKLATDDFIWGREMGILLTLKVEPSDDSIEYQDALTKRLMEWRPVNVVFYRRIQVLALEGRSEEMGRLCDALVRFYPRSVDEAREFLLRDEKISNNRTVRDVIEKHLVRKRVGRDDT